MPNIHLPIMQSKPTKSTLKNCIAHFGRKPGSVFLLLPAFAFAVVAVARPYDEPTEEPSVSAKTVTAAAPVVQNSFNTFANSAPPTKTSKPIVVHKSFNTFADAQPKKFAPIILNKSFNTFAALTKKLEQTVVHKSFNTFAFDAAKNSTATKAASQATAINSSVRFEQRRIMGINVKMVSVDLQDRRVNISPIFPKGKLGGGERFDKMVSGSSALAVINGGYFHPRTYSTASDLVVNGRFISSGKLRTGFGITLDHKAVVRVRAANPNGAWHDLKMVLTNGPFLLRRGKVTVYPAAEGYTDIAIQRRAPRSAIGVRSDHKLFFVSTRHAVNLYQLSKMMRALGAQDAIALDGGSSVGMAWQGKVLIRPKRPIAYGVGIYLNSKIQ